MANIQNQPKRMKGVAFAVAVAVDVIVGIVYNSSIQQIRQQYAFISATFDYKSINYGDRYSWLLNWLRCNHSLFWSFFSMLLWLLFPFLLTQMSISIIQWTPDIEYVVHTCMHFICDKLHKHNHDINPENCRHLRAQKLCFAYIKIGTSVC